MKRTPLKRIGKTGQANIEARKRIADICQEQKINRCEIGLEGCLGTWPLAPAHRHKRLWYRGSVELLSDIKQWVVACVVCHDKIENNRQLTEAVFNKLRGNEL